jgi:hypothetical protein
MAYTGAFDEFGDRNEIAENYGNRNLRNIKKMLPIQIRQTFLGYWWKKISLH